MTKVKLYNPDTQGTFRMMFGFAQPLRYVKSYKLSRSKIKKEYETRKKRNGQTKQEQGFNKKIQDH